MWLHAVHCGEQQRAEEDVHVRAEEGQAGAQACSRRTLRQQQQRESTLSATALRVGDWGATFQKYSKSYITV